jgi:hypothetical protein
VTRRFIAFVSTGIFFYSGTLLFGPLISVPGGTFLRASADPPRHYAPAGSRLRKERTSLSHFANSAGVAALHSNQLISL